MKRPEDRFFLVIVAAVSIALALLIRPFFGAILWAVIAALLFGPLFERLVQVTGGRRNTAASITVLTIVLLGVMPAISLGFAIVREVAGIYERIQTGGINVGEIFAHFEDVLPRWMVELLQRAGLSDLAVLRERLAGTIASGFQALATRAIDFSQSAFGFLIALGVMLYLSFFLLRDGQQISRRIERAVPLRPEMWRALIAKIVTVIRATMKGSFVIAIVQGVIGGVIFSLLGIGGALLWGIAMGFFSLLPAIGTGLIWVPVAIYLFLSGAFVKGAILVFCGLFVIGLIDNLLRPVLVGRDTQMPDYVVFISTLGGLELFGFNGIVVGPVIAALFIAIWDIFTDAQKEQAA
ncbi:MAG TPA: AI-2E family transporter [Sphingobium sp.]|nr:AI-2E family transporter [Sphingobium sp.]